MSDYKKFYIRGDESALKRLWDACHFYQDGDRDKNPLATPIISGSSADSIQVAREMELTARAVCMAAGVTLEDADSPEVQLRHIPKVTATGFDSITELRELAKVIEARFPVVYTGIIRITNELGARFSEVNGIAASLHGKLR